MIYHYSAKLYLSDIEKEHKYKNLASLAPYIDKTVKSDIVLLSSAKEEAKHAAKSMKGEVIDHSKYSKDKLLSILSDYNVIHFATHMMINHNDPLYSKILLSADSKEQKYFYGYEIFNSKLNSNLVVLSSCESGHGKYFKGEGVLNIARSFTVSGCRNIIISLWNVNDNSSHSIMKSFYKYLSRNNSISESLQKAQIDYLNKADFLHQHPFFWASFVLLGDNKL